MTNLKQFRGIKFLQKKFEFFFKYICKPPYEINENQANYNFPEKLEGF